MLSEDLAEHEHCRVPGGQGNLSRQVEIALQARSIKSQAFSGAKQNAVSP